jgi:hypothetical protein
LTLSSPEHPPAGSHLRAGHAACASCTVTWAPIDAQWAQNRNSRLDDIENSSFWFPRIISFAKLLIHPPISSSCRSALQFLSFLPWEFIPSRWLFSGKSQPMMVSKSLLKERFTCNRCFSAPVSCFCQLGRAFKRSIQPREKSTVDEQL